MKDSSQHPGDQAERRESSILRSSLLSLRNKPLRLFALAVLGIILTVLSGVGFVSQKEQNDEFCASCHTQPESEYFQRSISARASQSAVDLASFHHRKEQVKCIDCHGGEGVLGRAAVVSVSAWDAIKYYTGLATQPAHIVFPVQNEACIKCHQEIIDRPGFENHIHNKYNAENRAKEQPPFIPCANCHISHRQGDERQAFQFRDEILPRCEYCHIQMGRGPRGQAPPEQ